MIDKLELIRYFGSLDFIIKTDEIQRLQRRLQTCLKRKNSYMFIFGDTRCGKTKAIHYIANENTKLSYVYNATLHTFNEATFYSNMLWTVNHILANNGDVITQKTRLLNKFLSDAFLSNTRQIIFFFDEAQHLAYEEFLIIEQIVSELKKEDVSLFVCFVGLPELKSNIISFKSRDNNTDIFRDLLKYPFEFNGKIYYDNIEHYLDLMSIPLKKFSNQTLIEIFYPVAFKNDLKLNMCSNDLWMAYMTSNKKNGVKDDFILIKNFVDTVLKCLINSGIYGSKVYQPTIDEWKSCFSDNILYRKQIGGE